MSESVETYLGYIRDLAYMLRERAARAESDKERTGAAFDEGHEFGLRETLAWMQNQADIFGIPRGEVCLDGFDAMSGKVDPPAPKALGSGKD